MRAHSSVFPFCLIFCVCIYEFSGIAISPKLEGIFLCKVVPFVDCVPGDFDRLARALCDMGWVPGALHAGSALVGCLERRGHGAGKSQAPCADGTLEI